MADTDSDGDGTANCNDGCPNDPNKTNPGTCGCGNPEPGTACNDGNPNTTGDVIGANCICAGSTIPCPDDGNPCTLEEVVLGVCQHTPLPDTDSDGTCDLIDGCPNDPNKIAPGQCGCGISDADGDGDGTANCNDGCPSDPNKIAPGVCGCGVSDADSDSDGTPNCNDGCPNDPNKIAPGICGCGVSDADSDGDGTANCNDGCPNDPNKIAPGQCGCGVADTDGDSDGTADCNDGCPNDPNKTNPGTCGCGNPEPGTTCNDGNPNTSGDVIGANCICAGSTVPCPDDGNPCTLEEVVLGVCQHTPLPDTDSDGTCDLIDGCPNDPNKIAPGQCGCGISDADTDNDGTADCNDLCPNDPNKVAPGICGCGVSDADTDGDGTADCNDGCPNDPNKIAPGQCGCGVSDADGDGDGTADCIDGCPADPNKIAPGACGCGVADTDTDVDGTADCNDGCPNDPNKTAPGVCGCGVSDADTDLDGTADCNDGCPNDPNKTAPGQCGCGVVDTDTDSDGVADCNDNCPNIAGQQGSLCDDGDPDTSGDAINANCICEGSTTPCPDDGDPCTAEVVVQGVCTHPALPDTDSDGTCDLIDGCPNDPNKIAPGVCGCGVADIDTDGDLTLDCNDGCPNDPNKIAPGVCGCGVADTDTDGDLTLDCNDGCPNDPNKIAPGVCGCGVADTDADNDGVADCNDLCPNGPEPGTPCDDLDANTTGDVITANCVCAGVNVNCTEDLVLAISLDAFGSHTTWELYETIGNTLVEFGGPYSDGTPGAIVTTNLCVPAGCYELIVSDDFADGIAAGGYTLADDLGRRIIDADGAFSSTSSIVSTDPDFCVPLGPTFVKPNWCDRTDFVPSSWIYCQGVAGATGYQFWFFDPHGSYSRTILKPTTACRLNNLQTNPLPFDLPLNVRVRPLVNGNFLEYGKACRIIVNEPVGVGNLNTVYFATDEVSFNMYPNPNRDEVLYLMIEGLSDAATGADVEIFDAMGKLVASEHVTVAGGTMNHALTLDSEVGVGMYIVQVKVDGRVLTQRLMRQ
ncbi:MAG: thrombospondin type 3 repeat-containing protein [Flavobacteriales bacterium]|nr:thrombospondin type 3 repeat-containing protein [Flavobacteriales bacterium]